jgi:hypothetical protein
MSEIQISIPGEEGEVKVFSIDMANVPAHNNPCADGHDFQLDPSDSTDTFYAEVCRRPDCRLGRLVRRTGGGLLSNS